MKVLVLVSILVVFKLCSPVFANEVSGKSQVSVIETDITNSFEDKVLQKYWGLSEEEVLSYKEIMRGPLKYWNPEIDPLMALGLYANNDIDRERYAKQYAKQEHELIKRTLAFQRSYRGAFNALFPNANIIESKYLKGYYEKQNSKKHRPLEIGIGSDQKNFNKALNWKSGDRVIYFAEVECAICNNTLEKIISMIGNGVYIDVYIVGIKNEEEARAWVERNNINLDWLKTGKVTLNINTSLYEKLSQKSTEKSNSRFYLSRDDSIYVINKSQLGL